MAFISDEIMDQGLDFVGATVRVDITSQEATNYSEATTDGTHSVGNKTGLTTGATEGGSPSGRRIRIPAITDGTVTETDTATHWAVTDGSSILYATGALSAGQGVTDTNTFTLDAIDITILDAVAA